MDYEEIEIDFEESLKRYDETLALEKQEQRKRSNEYIRERIATNSASYKNSKRRYRIKRSDPSAMIVLLIIVLIIILLVIGTIKFVPKLFSSQSKAKVPETLVYATPIDTSVIEETPTETVIIETLPPETPVVESKLEIVMENPENYQLKLTGIDQVNVKFVFGRKTWIKVFIDEKVTDTPKSKVYDKGESVEIVINPAESKMMSIRLGNLIGTIITVNEQEITLDPSIKDYNSGITLNFKVENNEPTE